jgi:hypothetical protein
MAGNTVVLKPPSQGAVAGVHMAACFAAAGLPPGVVNIVTGVQEGHWLNPDVRMRWIMLGGAVCMPGLAAPAMWLLYAADWPAALQAPLLQQAYFWLEWQIDLHQDMSV